MTTETEKQVIRVTAPRLRTVQFEIEGVTPYVSNNFSAEAQNTMRDGQVAGGQAKSKRTRKPKDFDAAYLGSIHFSSEGWPGIPCSAFRNAMISGCRLVGYKMTIAKMSVFVLPDGFDRYDGTPLVKFTNGEPRHVEHHVRQNLTSTDIRARGMWDPGWRANVRVQWDEDQFSLSDVTNLLLRAGTQVGVGAGRPDSHTSNGMGWGLFKVLLDVILNEQGAAA